MFDREMLSDLDVKLLDKIDIEQLDFSLMKKYADTPFLFYSDSIISKDPFNIKIPDIKASEHMDFDVLYFEDIKEIEKIKEDFKLNGINLVDNDDINEDIQVDDTEVYKIVESMIYNAIKSNVSDIHVLPKEKSTVIFMREQGELSLYKKYEKGYAEFIVNKLKILGGLDISNKMIPQDGKIKMTVKGFDVEIRVSTTPTIFGENTVLRVQKKEGINNMSLETNGFFPEDLKIYRNAFKKPVGLILNVGPTGSGKTTTFALTIKEIVKHYKGRKNIMTVEDPVEIVNPDITQIEADDKAGRDFATVLRSLLRQDPDVILVGEIRDEETADIAMRASITGHLVLATLHANDTINAITRLRDIGVSNQIISGTSLTYLSQKLIRTLCPHCKKEKLLTNKVRDKYGLNTNIVYENNIDGCPKCKGGFEPGREAIIEVLDFDDEINSAISSESSEVDIKKLMKRKKFRNLWINAMKKVEQGRLSIQEAEEYISRDNILNKQGEDKVEKRIIYYPDKEIEIKMDTKDIGHLYDISRTTISILFDKTVMFALEKNYQFSIGAEQMVFVPKTYARFYNNEDSIIFMGTYKGGSEISEKLLNSRF